VATVRGDFEPDASVREFGRLLDHCRRDSIRSVLIDYRALNGRGYATQEILYAARVSEIYRRYLNASGDPVRLAYLGTKEFIQGWTPGVELARAEGLDVIATTDEGEARQWLAADSSS
jgi:hypothetical protein